MNFERINGCNPFIVGLILVIESGLKCVTDSNRLKCGLIYDFLARQEKNTNDNLSLNI